MIENLKQACIRVERPLMDCIVKQKNEFKRLPRELMQCIFSNPSLTQGELMSLQGGSFVNNIKCYYHNFKLVSKLFYKTAADSLPLFINKFSLPLSQNFNIKTEQNILSFSKRYGMQLENLDLTQFNKIDQPALQIILNNCTNIKKLKIKDKNKLNLDYSQLKNLEVLSLSVNSLKESTFEKFSSLKKVSLSSNDTELLHLDKFENIQELILSGCQDLSDISSISMLSNLKVLEIRNCIQLVDLKPLEQLLNVELRKT